MNTSEQDGFYTVNSSREETFQEKQRKEYLHGETCAHTGSAPCKRDRIIYVENSTNIREPFVIPEVGTVNEVLEKVCEKFPQICLHSFALRVYSARMGVTSRIELIETIPYSFDTLYITMFLRKHPRIM